MLRSRKVLPAKNSLYVECVKIFSIEGELAAGALGAHAGDCRVFAAERAGPVLSKIEHPKIRVEGIIDEQAALQGLSHAEYELEHFCGLDQADLSGHNTQDAHFTSGRYESFPWRNGPYTTQARSAVGWMKKARLTLESYGSTVDIWFSREEARIIHQIFRGEIV